MIEPEPGMRVRCVDASTYGGRKHPHLTHGNEYHLLGTHGEFVEIFDDTGKRGGWYANRFKPVVRVKAKCIPNGMTLAVLESAESVITEGPFAGMTEKEALDLVVGGY